MTRACRVIAAIFVAASVAASERIPSEVAQGRDLRSYEDGGVYRTPIGQRQVVGVSEARRFIWTHWTQKRRGYVTVVQQGKDAGSDSYIFIEPSPSGWHVLWRTRHYQALPHAPVYPVKDLPDIVGVARHGEQLLFRDAQGATVTKL
jgi:hypothetical protein